MTVLSDLALYHSLFALWTWNLILTASCTFCSLSHHYLMVYIYLFWVWVGVQGDSQRFLFYVFEQVEGLCLFWWVLFDLLLDLGLVYNLNFGLLCDQWFPIYHKQWSFYVYQNISNDELVVHCNTIVEEEILDFIYPNF